MRGRGLLLSLWPQKNQLTSSIALTRWDCRCTAAACLLGATCWTRTGLDALDAARNAPGCLCREVCILFCVCGARLWLCPHALLITKGELIGFRGEEDAETAPSFSVGVTLHSSGSVRWIRRMAFYFIVTCVMLWEPGLTLGTHPSRSLAAATAIVPSPYFPSAAVEE
jgi:hypothetical protein